MHEREQPLWRCPPTDDAGVALSPVGKVILGSIAQRLILEATVPVLSVKTANS